MDRSNSLFMSNDTSFDNYLKDIRKIDKVSGDEQILLAIKAQSGDLEARDSLIKSNLRFVISVAKDYKNMSSGLTLNDLVNEGNIGLINAIEKFDANKGFKFISYAVWWIKQSILQSIYENSNQIRIPVNKINDINKIKKAQTELFKTLNREPNIQELENYINKNYKAKMSKKDIKDSVLIKSECVSIDAERGEGEDFSLHETISDNEYESIETNMNYQSLRRELKEAFKSALNDRESKILVSYFDLDGDGKKTLKEIGSKVGISLTNERVRQIKERALRSLRGYKYSHLRRFLSYDFESVS